MVIDENENNLYCDQTYTSLNTLLVTYITVAGVKLWV